MEDRIMVLREAGGKMEKGLGDDGEVRGIEERIRVDDGGLGFVMEEACW